MTIAQAVQRPILYILSDIDGTIYPLEGPLPRGFYVHHGTLSQLIQFGNSEEGGKGPLPPIGFCTGREINYVIGATRSLTTPNSFSVVENGICLYNLATTERRNHPLLTKEAEEVFRNIRSRIPQLTHRFPGLNPYLLKEVNIALEQRYSYINLANYVEPVKEALSEFAEFIDVTYSGLAIDIMVKGINKGSGVLELCKWTGVSPEQMLVIGDSPNDFSAMEIVGYAGCPANAQKPCKQLVEAKGGYVSPYPVVIGVVDIILHYLELTN